MNAPLPAAIAVREVLHGGGARYELPRRPLGSLRFIGLVPLGFGAGFSLFAVIWMIAASLDGNLFGFLFALFGLPFFFAGIPPMAVGLFVLIGRCEIELRDGVLHTTERAGIFRWSRRQPADAIRQFNVRVSDPATAPSFLGSLAALDAACGKPKPFLIALGYPREWLQALGNDLARRCNLATPGRVLTADKLTVETVTEPLRQSEPLAQEENLNQPAGSVVTLEPQADGFTLAVPPAGIWRSNKGLVIFGVIWWSVVAAITGWLALFIVGVAGVLALAARLGRRRATIQATTNRLCIVYVGFLRVRTMEWPRDGLAAICVGPSGVEVNHKPVMELQVHPRAGRKFGLLADRDVAELQWIAAVLRQALGVSPTPPVTVAGGPRRNG
ncbi:MAG: hypothetical protein NT105_11100 [Verrucomicrobia bacterium]|nr:hypothetical protein [Verrucomicrobiota bacterium]